MKLTKNNIIILFLTISIIFLATYSYILAIQSSKSNNKIIENKIIERKELSEEDVIQIAANDIRKWFDILDLSTYKISSQYIDKIEYITPHWSIIFEPEDIKELDSKQIPYMIFFVEVYKDSDSPYGIEVYHSQLKEEEKLSEGITVTEKTKYIETSEKILEEKLETRMNHLKTYIPMSPISKKSGKSVCSIFKGEDGNLYQLELGYPSLKIQSIYVFKDLESVEKTIEKYSYKILE
ncbi:hypothetical protein SAMN05446037_104230 [Anaerovirgula multivorans]|uniref:Uncharacterized protein n=1 Tax=Anaerovirgula multivorans TaxID=312168 RepID=A0A239K4L8_9FIRM|nr:hypothetical protein [Anaerovirgula multivorans]SNT12632.1 hypothetical protein SAMN05446037_104230 [Anaerovirgula multivorans]